MTWGNILKNNPSDYRMKVSSAEEFLMFYQTKWTDVKFIQPWNYIKVSPMSAYTLKFVKVLPEIYPNSLKTQIKTQIQIGGKFVPVV